MTNPALLERKYPVKFKTKRTALTPDEFLTTRELMQLLKIRHKQTIYSLIREGMPAVHVGKNFRFIKNEVISFLKQSTKSRRLTSSRNGRQK